MPLIKSPIREILKCLQAERKKWRAVHYRLLHEFLGKDLPAQKQSRSSCCHFQSSQYLSLCPGSSNDWVDFFSSQEGTWLGPGSCSTPPLIIARGRGRKISPIPGKSGSLLSSKCVGGSIWDP